MSPHPRAEVTVPRQEGQRGGQAPVGVGEQPLHAVTDVATPPSQCSGVAPGVYVRVDVTYSYAPLFGNFTVVRMFGTSTWTTSYMRL